MFLIELELFQSALYIREENVEADVVAALGLKIIGTKLLSHRRVKDLELFLLCNVLLGVLWMTSCPHLH